MDDLEVFARCDNCGETWPEDGRETCDNCESDNISAIIGADDDNDDD